MIKVLFFGPVAERVGVRELTIPAEQGLTAQALYSQLANIYPEAFELVCFTALNGEQINDLSVLLFSGSELVFMSKYSGG